MKQGKLVVFGHSWVIIKEHFTFRALVLRQISRRPICSFPTVVTFINYVNTTKNKKRSCFTNLIATTFIFVRLALERGISVSGHLNEQRVSPPFYELGTLRSTTATSTKTSPQNITLQYRNSFVTISFTSYNVGEVS